MQQRFPNEQPFYNQNHNFDGQSTHHQNNYAQHEQQQQQHQRFAQNRYDLLMGQLEEVVKTGVILLLGSVGLYLVVQ